MPRPGPRPYDCMRRAWHSDTHESLRANLIHEIFRVAVEIHSSNTRRNKEWQHKLPFVVVRAEEILYSKANSEAEYKDIRTLKDRIEDAINTMIRRDESTEHGQYLRPCVEAALYLGCHPKKSSRGQRHDSHIYGHNNRALFFVPAMTHFECNRALLKPKSEDHNICIPYVSSSMIASSRVNSFQYDQAGDVMFSSFPPCLAPNATNAPLPRHLSRFGHSKFNGKYKSGKVLNIAPKEFLLQKPKSQSIVDSKVLSQISSSMLSTQSTFSESNLMVVPNCFSSKIFTKQAMMFPHNGKEAKPLKESSSMTLIDLDSNESSYCKPSVKSYSDPILKECTCEGVDMRSNAFQALTKIPEKEQNALDKEACDLHLRLGPSSAARFKLAVNGSVGAECLVSRETRTKASADAVECMKVSDSSISSSCESNQDVLTLSPSHMSSFDVRKTHLKESRDLVFTEYMYSTDCVEMPSKKCRKYNQTMVKDNLFRPPNEHEDILDLQIRLGLPLYGSCHT